MFLVPAVEICTRFPNGWRVFLCRGRGAGGQIPIAQRRLSIGDGYGNQPHPSVRRHARRCRGHLVHRSEMGAVTRGRSTTACRTGYGPSGKSCRSCAFRLCRADWLRTAALRRPSAFPVEVTQWCPHRGADRFPVRGSHVDCPVGHQRDARRCGRVLVGVEALASLVALLSTTRGLLLRLELRVFDIGLRQHCLEFGNRFG